MMEFNSQVKKHSFLHQNPKFTEVFSPRASRGSKSKEKDKASQPHATARDTDGRPLFPPQVPGNYQKLWPSRVSVGSEELVKHMSNVPAYLHRSETRGVNLQEKALNVGVLDWQRLERWTDSRRRGATVNGDASGSPASSNASSSFSTFGSSSQSCTTSSAGSYPDQRNRSPSANHHPQDSSAEGALTSMAEGASHEAGRRLPEMTSGKCPVRRRISVSMGRCQEHTDDMAAKNEEEDRTCPPVLEHVYDNLVPSPGAGILPPRSKVCEISDSVYGKMRPHELLRSDLRNIPRVLGHVRRSTSPSSIADCPQDHHSGLLFWLGGGMLDHFHGSIRDDRRLSLASRMNCATPTESARASFIGTPPSEDSQPSSLSPSVPHSCPLPSAVQRNAWSHMHSLSGEAVPFNSFKPSRHSIEVATPRLGGNHDKYAIKLQKNYAAGATEGWYKNGSKAVTTGRRPSTTHHSNGCLIRSSSSRESADIIKLSKRTSLSSQSHEGETDANDSRRSPLRRLLDPLLKGLTISSPRLSTHGRKLPMQGINCGRQSLSHTDTRPCGGGIVKEVITPSTFMPTGIQPSAYEEKHDTSLRQALLQLSWRNGLPLYTFSVNESDILAASRKKGTSGKEDCGCIYTFYYVQEIKKKIGGWISHGNKGKRKELVSNIVGDMNVSCLRCTKNHFVVREFILFGPELRPKAHENSDPVPSSELAAIILRVPAENTESFIDNLPHINDGGDCLVQPNLGTNRHASSPGGKWGSEHRLEKNYPKLVAILPSEVHGLSDTGKPATLVERWKSGGLCDCGGWDAGCSLTILTNNVQDSMPGVQSCNAMDGARRLELFIQGGGQERKPLLSLLTFSEGLYTVDFHASVEVLQAFAVCVAILHGRKPSTSPQELQGSRLCKPVESYAAGKQVASSMTHPPLSPVGRA